MRPLDDLEPARCRDLAGVVFDVDDTLTDHGCLTDHAYRALWDLARGGLSLVAVTGRPLGWCDLLAVQWPLTTAVGENGAGWVWRQGSHSHEGYFDDETARADQRRRLAEVQARALAEIEGLRLARDQRHRRVDLAFDVAEEARLPPAGVERLVKLIEAAGAHALVSSVHAHAFFGNHDKASGVARAVADVVGRDLAAERERWLFIGDSGNDAAAFAYFPLSAAVGNVRAHLARLPVQPAFVTDEERGRGFVAIAAAVLRHRHGR